MGIILKGIQYWHEAEDDPIDDTKEYYDDRIPVFDRGNEKKKTPYYAELDFNEWWNDFWKS